MGSISGSLGGSSGIGAIPWDPITNPNLIRSGVGIQGQMVLILQNTLVPLDGVMYYADDYITFDSFQGKWVYVNQSIEDRVALLEGAFDIVGNYDASTNTPDLNAILGISTDPYNTWVTNIAGTQNITGIGSYAFSVGDRIVVNASNNGYFVEPNASTGLPTAIITTATYSLSANTSYIVQAGQNTTLTLPTVAAFGDVIEINCIDNFQFIVAQNAGQTIKINGSSTTTGIAGYIESIDVGSSISLKCTSSNIEFKNQSQSGNFNIL